MSGIIHSVTKVFSKVWDFIRPIVIPVLIAAAAYFTVGLALSAFPATAGFAAALPGFAGAGGAGTGIFSSLATSIGLGSGLQAGAAADALASAGAAGIAGAGAAADAAAAGSAAAGTAGTAAGAAGGLTAVDAASALPEVTVTAAAPTAGAGVAAAGTAAAGAGTLLQTAGGYTLNTPSVVGNTAGAVAKSSLTDKLLLAGVLGNTVGGLLGPSPADIQAAKNGFYGAFYGTNANGTGAAAPDLSVGPQTEPGRTYTPGGTVQADQQIPGVNIPSTPQAAAGNAPGAGANAQSTFQSAQQQKLIPTIPYSGQPAPGTTPDFAVQGTTPLPTPKLIGPQANASNPTAPA